MLSYSKTFFNNNNYLSILKTKENDDSDPSINEFFDFPLSSNLDFLYNNLKYLEKNGPNITTKYTSKITENLNEYDLKKIFNKNDLEENIEDDSEKIYLIDDKKNIKKNKKTPFITNKKIKKPPGKKRIKNNSIKAKHSNAAFDNLLSKIQVHYINFIREVANDAIKTELKLINALNFKDIDYIFKRCIKFNYFEELKTIPIKVLLCKPITKKFRKVLSKIKNYNQEVYNEACNKSQWLKDFFEQNYISFFHKYYYNNIKELKAINFNGKEIILSKKAKSFYHLINDQNNKELKKKLIECVETAY